MKFLISLFLVLSLYSQVIDKISVIVNNEPITSYDIYKTEQQFNFNKQQAVSYLIDKAVLQSEIKQRGIYIDEFDIDNAMKKIAQRNGMSLFNFKDYLLQRGELYKLEAQIKSQLEKEKLLQTLNIRVTQDEMKNYYKEHQNKFLLPSKIETTKYSSNNKAELQKVMNSPLLSMNNKIQMEDLILDINKTNPRLLSFLAKYSEKTFTPIVNFDNMWTTFYIIKKDKPVVLPYKVVEGKIYADLMRKKDDQELKDFIAKLRAKADIKFLN